MLKRVAPKDVELGMFIQAFEGSWLDHPFWRTRFRITTKQQLQAVRASAVSAVLVDMAQSGPVTPAAVTEKADPAQPRRPAWSAPDVREFAQAQRLVNESKLAVTKLHEDVRLGRAVQGKSLIPLVESIASSISRDAEAFVSVARLKSKHEYTYMHSVAVCALMISFAKHLRLGADAEREAGLAGLLHDIGKAAIPVSILDKPGPLDEQEFAVVRGHPIAGYELLKAGKDLPNSALEVCLRHHERVDGTGYPDGLRGDQLSLLARMGAICDVYDAVTSARAYKAPWDPNEAMSRMKSWTGHFDEILLEAFARSIGIYPVGALVRLQDQRLGIVAGTCPEDPTHPPVFALQPLSAGSWAISLTALSPAEITSVEDPEQLGMSNFEALRASAMKSASGVLEKARTMLHRQTTTPSPA